MSRSLFAALLKFWRGKRGLSQLELALEAGVSARHVSFLESGRSMPSEEMALRLFEVLGVPLRAQNEALRAAGLAPRFAEGGVGELGPEIDAALAQMRRQHEPYPLTVLALDTTLVATNEGARRLFAAFSAEPLPSGSLDMLSLVLDPRRMRPFLLDWEPLAASMIGRLHRLELARGGDARIRAKLDHALAQYDVPARLHRPDFSRSASPTLGVRLQRGERRLAFLVTATVFTAPQAVALDELVIESSFPVDEATRIACAELAAGS
ncbi:MAG: helix-turn-helix transcriptional regulator [Sandaracinus sp.]